MAKSNSFNEISISYHNKLISSTFNTKFIGMVIESSLSWKGHIFQIMPKLCKACYAVRAVKPFMSQETLKSVSCSYFQLPY
jgi:hypothetical protein